MSQRAGANPDQGWRPKLVVLDLDGTVVPYYQERALPNQRVRDAVAATLAAGVPVTIATGRAVWSALPTAADLGLHGIQLVCSNGAVVFDADARQVRHEVTFDPTPAAQALLSADVHLAFAVERGLSGFLHTADFHLDFPSKFFGVADLPELLSQPTTRLVARPSDGDTRGEEWHGAAARWAEELVASVLDPAKNSWETGYTGWIDVSGPNVNKATGAAMLAADLGVDVADVLAIGDGSNDMPMLRWAGRSVAMGQAPDKVKAVADVVTATVDEDGVAVELERWFG
ncbi:Cof-type HAD-IIB family hydrolase [Fodinicola feengrottensis]|uniref:Cof-type HAD-IIB family hydrolase n=1 Tax=Fodinicola feengrottensis TaxID=435914 RepID=A0ABN2GTE5_9ACTN